MIDKMFIKPNEGISVRDPYRRDRLPKEGRLVEKNSYWISMIKTGDVILSEENLANKNGGVQK